MKTVSASVISSNLISLSKAASFLNDFVSAKENGASQAVSAFLKRTSTAFSELNQFHEQLETEISAKKEKRRHFEELANGKVMGIDEKVRKEAKMVGRDGKSHRVIVAKVKEEEETIVHGKSHDFGNAQSVNCIENGGSGKKKKKKEMSEVNVEVQEMEVREPGGGGSDLEGGSGKKKKKKREETSEVKEEEVREPEEVGKETNKKRKKRKKVEDESTTSLDNSEERHSRKKKKQKHGDY